jgi:hypothetical protein
MDSRLSNRKLFCKDLFSLTPRFNAVSAEYEREKPFKRFFFVRAFNTRLKPGVNEKFSTKQRKILNWRCWFCSSPV